MTQLLTAEQAGQMLAVSEREVYKLRARGQLGCVRIGSRIRFREADIEEYIERQRERVAEAHAGRVLSFPKVQKPGVAR